MYVIEYIYMRIQNIDVDENRHNYIQKITPNR